MSFESNRRQYTPLDGLICNAGMLTKDYLPGSTAHTE